MAESDDKPPEKKLSPWKQFLEDVSWDIWFFRAFGNLLFGLFFEEGKAVKSGWFAFAVFTVIAFWGGCHYSERNIDAKLSGITNYFSGELDKKEADISELRGELSDAKADRDKNQLMLAPFQAMAIAKYTNAPMDQRLDLLAQGMAAITNALGNLHSDIPSFELRVNDSTNSIMSGSVLALSEAREIKLWVGNIGNATAENLTIAITAPISSANLNFSGWRPQAGIVELNTMKTLDWLGEWRTVSDQSVAIGDAFEAPPLILSKRLTSPSFTVGAVNQVFHSVGSLRFNLPTNSVLPALPVEIRVYADRSKAQVFDLFFTY
jgi:hypothetical protein